MDFSSLINIGYTASDILGGLTKNGGAAAKKITQALNRGYSAATILNHLLGGKEGDESYMTLEEKTHQNFEKQKKKAALDAGLTTLAALGGASALLGRNGAGQAAGALAQGALGAQQPSQPATQPQQGQAQPQQAMTPPQSAIVNRLPSAGQPSAAVPQQAPQQEPDAWGKLSKDFPQIEQFVKKHLEVGKSPEEIHRLIKSSKTLSSLAKRFEDATGEDFRTVIDRIAETNKPEKKTSKKELIDNVNVLKNLMTSLRDK